MRDYDLSDFEGDGPNDAIAGPLIGGGVAQVGTLVSKLMFAGKAPAKWAGLIGATVGGLAGAGLMVAGRRGLGLSAMVTALLVGIPRQLEDMLAPGGVMSGLGVITPEELAAWGAEGYDAMGVIAPHELEGYDAELGEPPLQLLGTEPPVALLGENTPGSPVQLLGDGSFGILVPEELSGVEVAEISGAFGASIAG